MGESDEPGKADGALKPRGRPFQKGNPGRPRGSRNKTTKALRALLDGQAEAITSKAIELALEGDRTALKICFERIVAKPSDRSISLRMPEMRSAADGATAMAAVVAAVTSGQISPGEGAALGQLISATMQAFANRDFEKRIEDLEKTTNRR